MRILALETSSRCGSVALLADERLIGSSPLLPGQRTAAVLAPTIAAQLDVAGWKAADIDLVAVAQGPGSFTGLRIGVTMAKTLAYAISAEVIGVNTLEVIAAQAACSRRNVWAVIDAQRQQLFASMTTTEEAGPTRLIDNQQWLAQLKPSDAVNGSGLRKLVDRLPTGVEVCDQSLWTPQAEMVARIGLRHFQAGRRDDMWKLVPQYYRPSYAEEKLKE